MKLKLSSIKNTEPRRGHGDIEGLKASILEVGLINPLTVDEEGNLLGGRRRFQAICELGWDEVDVRVVPVRGDALRAFRVSIDENVQRKQLTDFDTLSTLKQYLEMSDWYGKEGF